MVNEKAQPPESRQWLGICQWLLLAGVVASYENGRSLGPVGHHCRPRNRTVFNLQWSSVAAGGLSGCTGSSQEIYSCVEHFLMPPQLDLHPTRSVHLV